MESVSINTATESQDSDQIATWNMSRSISQLRGFVARHDEQLDVEDFDL